jgi:hypothetical protein
MNIEFHASLTPALKLTGRGPTKSFVAGSADIPALSIDLMQGTGVGKISGGWGKFKTVASGADWVIDLTALTDADDNAMALVGVKEFWVLIDEPDGAKNLLIGNNPSNSFQGSLSAGGTWRIYTVYHDPNPSAGGHTVDGTHKNILIHNPTGADIDCAVIIAGVV